MKNGATWLPHEGFSEQEVVCLEEECPEEERTEALPRFQD